MESSTHLFIQLQRQMNELDKLTRGKEITDEALRIADHIRSLGRRLYTALAAEQVRQERDR